MAQMYSYSVNLAVSIPNFRRQYGMNPEAFGIFQCRIGKNSHPKVLQIGRALLIPRICCFASRYLVITNNKDTLMMLNWMRTYPSSFSPGKSNSQTCRTLQRWFCDNREAVLEVPFTFHADILLNEIAGAVSIAIDGTDVPIRAPGGFQTSRPFYSYKLRRPALRFILFCLLPRSN